MNASPNEPDPPIWNDSRQPEGSGTLRDVRTVLALVALVAIGAVYSLNTASASSDTAEERVVVAPTVSESVGARCTTGDRDPTGRITGESVGIEEGLGLDADCVGAAIDAGRTVTIASAQTVARLCAPIPGAEDGCWNGSRLVVPVDAWLAGDTVFSERLELLAP